MPVPTNGEEIAMNACVIRFGVGGLIEASLVGLAPAAFAHMVKYRPDLKPPNEVPAIVDSKGSGTFEATYDPITKKLTYILAWRDLTGPATAAHFHGPADAKTNAGVAVPINVEIGNPIKGAADLTDA